MQLYDVVKIEFYFHMKNKWYELMLPVSNYVLENIHYALPHVLFSFHGNFFCFSQFQATPLNQCFGNSSN